MRIEVPTGRCAAWEWRAFWAADGRASPLGPARQLAARLGVETPSCAVAEEDIYLVASTLPHNLKLRRGTLELKVHLRRLAGGFSIWEDKRSWVFPMNLDEVRRLWTWMPDPWACPPCGLRSTTELVSYLRQQETDLTVVPVHKQRVRLELGTSRLEVASLVVAGDVTLLSYCVDGYDLGAVREVVRTAGLRSNGRALSYVELLREPACCLPKLGQAEAAA